MKVYWLEIPDIGFELDLTAETPWLQQAVAQVDETFDQSDVILDLKAKSTPNTQPVAPAKTLVPRAIEGHLTLRRIDEIVMLTGNIKTEVELICSRCAKEFMKPVSPSLSSIFCTDPTMAGIASLKSDGSGPTERTHGYARHEHKQEDPEDPTKNLDITYISDDFIDLAETVAEQLRMEVPFQPLCSETCKGFCN